MTDEADKKISGYALEALERVQARRDLAKKLSDEIDKFFDPEHIHGEVKPDIRALLAYDIEYVLGELYFYRRTGQSSGLFPFGDLEQRLAFVFERMRDLSDVPVTTRYQGTFPRIKEALPHALSAYRNAEVFSENTFYELRPDGNINRAIDHVRLFPNSDEPPIGDIWVGYKWTSLPAPHGPYEGADSRIKIPLGNGIRIPSRA